MSVVHFWDDTYRDLTAPVTFSGGKPSAEVVEAAKRLLPGARCIDIGCGDGRNALHLASLGYRVTATDISPVGIAKVRQFAAERGLAINASVQDLRYATFDTEYDLIVSMGCLHWVEREYWEPLLRRIQVRTCAGGYNAIGIFTDALPGPEDQRDFYIGLFRAGELFDYYTGWEIITQRSVEFHDEHPGGIRHHHAGETVLARRV